MAYKDIVNINITRQTTSVSVAAFNVPLILSTFASGASGTPSTFTRTKSYGSVKALEDDAKKFSEVAKGLELLLVPSDSFGYSGYVRISYCVSTEQIKNSLFAFEKLMNYYKDKN